jgi:hypothetical protein
LIRINAAIPPAVQNRAVLTGIRFYRKIALIAVMVSLLLACASQPPSSEPSGPGFLLGLLHGFFARPALVGSLFLPLRVYAFPNRGFGYELGFVMGFGASNVAILLSLIARIGGFLVRKT